MSVYFAQKRQRGLIKIGWSRSVFARISAFGAKRLLGSVPGTRSTEREIHERFAHLRVHGEWFEPAEDLLTYIRDHARGHVPDSMVKMTGIRLPRSILNRVDKMVVTMSAAQPGIKITRASLLRLAVHRGVERLEGESGKPGT